MQLRRPTPADLPQLAALYRESRVAVELEFAPEYLAPRIDEAKYFRRIWDSTFANPDSYRAWVLWDDARPLGFVRVGPLSDYAAFGCPINAPPRTGEVHQIYLLPGLVNRGYGLMLLKAGLKDLKDMGFTGLIGCTYEKNQRARDFIVDMGGHHLCDGVLQVGGGESALTPHTQACSFYYAELPDSLQGALARVVIELSE